ncbi:hypothetical protein ABD87_15045 [Lysinibacillus sphaericus]|uniref:hypothetical protein n=1 Tax=Lysinibacillus sphaericus TaxID=1421 RepID=UPI0018CCDA1C|nr:hypothetical protein [Lysinibacillus sphaericus]MBG9730807.1 hypothetical protein [Lysinibacillus sphaericus]
MQNTEELKNEKYHFSPIFIAIIYVGTILSVVLSMFITAKFPLVKTPYIGEYVQSIINIFFVEEGTLYSKMIKEPLTMLLNVYIYWCLLLVPFYLLTDLFFKHLIGHEIKLVTSLKLTAQAVIINITKYSLLMLLLLFCAFIAEPIKDFFLLQLNTDSTLLVTIMLHVSIIGVLFILIKSAVIFAIKKTPFQKKVCN